MVATQTFCIFHPIPWGNDPIWRSHMFQMGWFNHQLAMFINTCNEHFQWPDIAIARFLPAHRKAHPRRQFCFRGWRSLRKRWGAENWSRFFCLFADWFFVSRTQTWIDSQIILLRVCCTYLAARLTFASPSWLVIPSHLDESCPV